MTTEHRVVNYDGSIVASPRQLVLPQSVGEIQDILRDSQRFPGPVRAMGSYHSLTPCASSEGTIVDMKRMNRIITIDHERMLFTAEAGMQFIDASKALRAESLQFMTNIEIGNMTLGAAACCHSKDALDGIEFGQVSSYVTKVKWVSASGERKEASAEEDPELLHRVRSSYGLCGIIYEVSFRVKPLEAIHFSYRPRPIDELTEQEVASIIEHSDGLVCWTVDRTAVFQSRNRVAWAGPLSSFEAASRHRLWNHTVALSGRAVDLYTPSGFVRDMSRVGRFNAIKALYYMLHAIDGITMYGPDKTVNYIDTPPSARYAFTFWAFPRAQWLTTLREYLEFSDHHYRQYGFRCNMPLGSYYIRQDRSSLLSYTHDGDIFSIDPIHAVTNAFEWERFLREFNDWAYQRRGIPLLNQSPFVERRHVEAAYGERWRRFSDWVREQDPNGRMLNDYFRELLAVPSVSAPA